MPEENVAIVRQHLLIKEPISRLCDELGLQPTVGLACKHQPRRSSQNGQHIFSRDPFPDPAKERRLTGCKQQVHPNRVGE